MSKPRKGLLGRLSVSPEGGNGALSPEFNRLLSRERALSDRYAHRFALLVFARQKGTAEDVFLQAMEESLTKRLRITDIAGLMEDARVGVIMPYSEYDAAVSLAMEICESAGRKGAYPECMVYTYPIRAGNDAEGTPVRKEPPAAGDSASARASETTLRAGDSAELLAFTAQPLSPGKRMLDILVSGLALVLFSPLMLGMALLIKLTSPGPIFFRQERVGRFGKSFTCFKFRTMHLNAVHDPHREHVQQLIGSDEPMVKLDAKRDPRLIPFGRLLRATGMDELPQLANVLRGEMSLVGPRPCIRYEYDKFEQWHKRRCDTLPGLTGLWQVSGKNRTSFREMMRLDVTYASNPSLWADLRIMWRTAPALWSQVRDLSGGRREEEN